MFFTLSGKTFFLPQEKDIRLEIQQLLHTLSAKIQSFAYYSQGRPLTSFDRLTPLTTIHACVPLKGGKGGYGAKLKTEGGKKVRPNDNMFSRDMSGQRLVFATMETQFRQFVVAKHQEDKRVAQEREQFKVMESTLKEGQSFMKLDKTYKKEIEQTEKKLIDSIKIGKQNALLKQMKLQQSKFEKQQLKQEQKKANDQPKLQINQEQMSLKRSRPEAQEKAGECIAKKVKINNEVKTESSKAVFSSAQERFKALFKK